MGLLNPHLDDGALAEVYATRTTLDVAESDRPEERHLRVCGECRVRYASFTTWLDSLAADGRAEADEAFGADRLLNQQTQILRRLEALEHPARVIAFPRASSPVSIAPGGRRRWIAAAAAAGLVVGVGLGQVFEFGTSAVRRSAAVSEQRQLAGAVPAPDSGRRGMATPVSPISDETFLDDMEAYSTSARVPESLQYLNAVTPLSRDFDPR